MRTFAGTLLFESIFEYVPTTEPELHNLSLSVFEPNVLIAESDCKTTLGKFETVNYEAEGLTELSTETPLSNDRITTLLSGGIYSIATRHTSTCISKDGVCKKCYSATYPDRPVPNELDRANIYPEYLVNAEIVELKTGVNSYSIKTEEGTYEKCYAFKNGVFLVPGTDYSITSNTITLNQPVLVDQNLVLRLMKKDRSAFLGWLANSYSGSMLGMKPIPIRLLPIRPLFLASTLFENRLQSSSELIKKSSKIPREYSEYIDLIKDPLEKALYMLAIFSIYNNVSS